MTDFTPEFHKHGPGKQAELRLDAETRLKEGSAPLTNGWTLSAGALTLLYKLASSPDSAADALRLLHELQAYQVELDLQHTQLEANERESALELARYKFLYEFAPVGYLVVGLDGRLIESNPAGAELLGVARDEAGGRPVDSFLGTGSRLAFARLLKQLRDGASGASCEVQSGDTGSGSRWLRIVANISPGGEAVLMMVSECDRMTDA